MCNSLTKSYMGTAIGLAYTEGLLKLEDRLIDIFPEYAPESPSKWIDKLTVRNVLVMGTGMRSFPSEEGNWVKNFINHEIVEEPGTTYFYNSVGSTFLGKIIERLTGKDVYTYLSEKLFDKIGIDSENIDHGIAPKEKDMWAWRTVSTTEDNLRLMKLYADGGVWDGERILDEEYVKLATSLQNESASEQIGNPGFGDNYVGYGFQIWMCQYPGAYRADGAGGQFSIVIPDKDMIISINENAYGFRGPQKTLDLIWEEFMPLVNDNPLPEDADSYGRLKEKMRRLSHRAPEFRPYSPIKKQVSGKYLVCEGSFSPYLETFHGFSIPDCESFELSFENMRGMLTWHGKDRSSLQVSFLMNGQRQYNSFVTPWQFATDCYASAYWKEDNKLCLELLWPENGTDRTIDFCFEGEKAVLEEKVSGAPGSAETVKRTVAYKQ